MEDIVYEVMNFCHLEEVALLEEKCFSDPWNRETLEHELINKDAVYVVGLLKDKVISYASMWCILCEADINRVAVDPNHRSKGLGRAIAVELVKRAKNMGMDEITLEVRSSNTHAVAMYKDIGFVVEGVRSKYYDGCEDALIMWMRELGKFDESK